jgi:DNA helicase-2/ATP-dependent DNA helicase PcrA
LLKDIFQTPEPQLQNKIDVFQQLCILYYPEINRDVLNKSINTLTEVLSDSNKISTFKPADKDQINLMTIHKAKGLEFNIVFHLDLYNYFGKNEEDINLHYVAITRAIDACYLVTSKYRHNKKTGDLYACPPSEYLTRSDLAKLRKDFTW